MHIDQKTESCSKINGYEIDIFIPKLLYCIEYDGEHFHNSNISKKRELLKNYAILNDKNNNYKFFRIKETKDPEKIKKYHEIIDGVEIYYISSSYNKHYFNQLTNIINDILNINIKLQEIKNIYANIRGTNHDCK